MENAIMTPATDKIVLSNSVMMPQKFIEQTNNVRNIHTLV